MACNQLKGNAGEEVAGRQQGVALQDTSHRMKGNSNDCRLAMCIRSSLAFLFIEQEWCFPCTEVVQLGLTVSCMAL